MGQYYKPVNLRSREWVYSHDYSNGLKLMEHSYVGNGFVRAVERLLGPGGDWYKDPIVWAGDYADPERNADGIPGTETLYGLMDNEDKVAPEMAKIELRFLVNHSKHEFVDMKKLKAPPDGYIIHPLPLLTCEGNGRGGGDYDGTFMELVGTWARCSISMEKAAPSGYREIKPDFREQYG